MGNTKREVPIIIIGIKKFSRPIITIKKTIEIIDLLIMLIFSGRKNN